jgi:hypothetical protein
LPLSNQNIQYCNDYFQSISISFLEDYLRSMSVPIFLINFSHSFFPKHKQASLPLARSLHLCMFRYWILHEQIKYCWSRHYFYDGKSYLINSLASINPPLSRLLAVLFSFARVDDDGMKFALYWNVICINLKNTYLLLKRNLKMILFFTFPLSLISREKKMISNEILIC